MTLPTPLKIMIVGDSISHGREGDHTWRYRLFSWLSSQSLPFQFVGPYKGTVPPDPSPQPPKPPPLINEPPGPSPPALTNGGYAKSCSSSFLSNSDHFCMSGRQLYQAKDLIAEQVTLYQPDICLVALGFNDLAWLRTSPSFTLDCMKELIDSARRVKPELKFAVANVCHRTELPGKEGEDLVLRTDIYNALLGRKLAEYEDVELVRLCEGYSCGPGQDSRGAYDGLHPNARGEWEIARAFSLTLVKGFGIGRDGVELPRDGDWGERKLDVPRRVRALSFPCGVRVRWGKVYGAYGYEVECLGRGMRYVAGNGLYETGCGDGEVFRYKVRACYGDFVRSGWTEVVEGVARPETSPPPRNIRVWATDDGLEFEFERPEGKFAKDIDRYGVVIHDYCLPGSWPRVYGVKGERGRIPGLEKGHRYGISVTTWNKAGEGPAKNFEREVVVGRVGMIAIPRGLKVRAIGANGIFLTWPVDYNVGGYDVWGMNTKEGRQECIFKCPVDSYECGRRIVNWLEPSEWLFAVKAHNGSTDSELSEWVGVSVESFSLNMDHYINIHIEY
ncbi:receptor-type tyrosine-protein phosphatase F [Podospora fimiseda]|uniref:Receptor-type tyrosine-protein phosphatase F n=1 Tax=Podospora fimiseda TaxID=252190 RepID=A0AAN7BMG3_9PEZI|nr:receptor-type tyrosine-protein phosphatase F [Podospora fimiseda]